MTAYKYAPLKDHEIRILILHPGNFEDDIYIDLVHERLIPPADHGANRRLSKRQLEATLKDDWKVVEDLEGRYTFWKGEWFNSSTIRSSQHPNPEVDPALYAPFVRIPDGDFEQKFEALSYVWGSLEHTITIYVTNAESSQASTLQVGPSLAEALRHLRLVESSRRLWVDAVCIEQHHQFERNSQVKRMESIFGLASRVIMWLGPSSEDSALALTTLSHIASQAEVTPGGDTYRAPNASELEWYASDQPMSLSEAQWDALTALYEMPYWFRVWTLQEIMLANHLSILQCGNDKMPFADFRRATYMLNMKPGNPLEFVHILALTANGIEASGPTCHMDLENYCIVRNCSDPRDKVYGLLSLASDNFRSRIQPQYSLPVGQVYKEALLAQIELSLRLDVFCFLGNERSELEMPSWVPNWVSPQKASVSIDWERRAAGVSKAHTQYVGPGTLEVVAVKCGEVVERTRQIAWNRRMAIDLLAKWKPKGHFNDSSLEEQLHVAVCLSNFKEHYPDRHRPKKRDWIAACKTDFRRALGQMEDHNLYLLQGSCGFTTSEGKVGFGPVDMKQGDQIYVLLGCSHPIIIRSTSWGKHMVIGPCYIQGLMDAEALLGELPPSWANFYRLNSYEVYSIPYYVNIETDEETVEDPRLGPPPPEWRRVEKERSRDDPEHVAFFQHRDTGEIINHDPRMSFDMLEKRGVQLEKVRLI